MILKEEDVQSLSALGLNHSQARVYLALVNLGRANGRTIWKNSGVSRQDVYRLLNELQMKGLIEKIISTPTEFRAFPIQDGLSILLGRKAREYENAEVRAKELLPRLETYSNGKKFAEHQFSLIPENEASVNRFAVAFSKTQESVDGIFYGKGFLELITKATERWNRALERGIKFRFIVCNPMEDKTVTRTIRAFNKRGHFCVRYTSNPPPATVTIFDREKVMVTTAPTPIPQEVPSLWLENLGIVVMVQQYFESMWQNSIVAVDQ
ncbi:MAG: TrmB family transcriptional regulator [Candidatus Bathyarchaeia archaeon]